ncbi:MAG: hypothetical protein JO332_12445 [Planctomycetaceae bacterium]|nr:hypothetical protein [Planctomycetaceae bacterium]
MLKRQALFFLLLAAPVAAFSVRRPVCLSMLPLALVGAWWAASPVSYPRWIALGLRRAVPLAAVESLALWWFTR